MPRVQRKTLIQQKRRHRPLLPLVMPAIVLVLRIIEIVLDHVLLLPK